MDHKTVEDYLLSMPNARLEYPFGEGVAVYKVCIPDKSSISHADEVQGAAEDTEGTVRKSTVSENRKPATQQFAASSGRVASSAGSQDGAVRGDWKMFAIIQEAKDPLWLSLKCDPQLAIVLREKYETVLEGYHLNKKHWNTIILTGQLPLEEIQGLIVHSYNLVSGEGDQTAPTQKA